MNTVLMLSMLLSQAVEVPDAEPTLKGQLMSWALFGVLALLGAGIVAFAAFIVSRIKTENGQRLFNELFEIAKSVVAHVMVHVKPMIVKSLADGKVTAEEAAAIKTEAMKLFKEAAKKKLPALMKVLGGTGTLDVILSGILERALAFFKLQLPQATPTFPVVSLPNASSAPGAVSGTVTIHPAPQSP